MLEVKFQLNNCGQKSATVGIKIDEKFSPEVYLCRHLAVCIGINFVEFQKLRREMAGISSFFEDARDAKKAVYLSDELRVKFDVLQPYGKVVIVEKIGDERNISIYYVRSTWQRFVRLSDLMYHHMIRLQELIPEIEEMIKSLGKEVHANFGVDLSKSIGVETIQKILSQIKFTDHINESASKKVDWFEIYQNIMHYCPEKVIIACRDIVINSAITEEKENEEEIHEEVDAPVSKKAKK